MVPSLASDRKMSFMRPPSGCSSLQLGSDGFFVLLGLAQGGVSAGICRYHQ